MAQAPSTPTRWPLAVIAVAVLAAALHTVPLVTAQRTVPAGWRFTGIHQSSPDLMQYRQWFRQTQLEGPVISNRLTSEPHQPYMLVVFAWAIGKVSTWTGVAPEFVYAYAGCLFAFLLVLVLYRLTEVFVDRPAPRWWIFAAMLLGGGLGGHLKLLMRFESVRRLPGVERLVWAPMLNWNLFEDYRGQFVFSTFFDTHFLLAWLCTSASVLLLYRAIQKPTPARLAVAAVLAAFTGVVHLHSGLSVVIIAAGIAWMCHIGRQHAREALISLAIVGGAAVAGVAAQALLMGPGGLPTPPWRARPIEPSILFLAYTLQWIMAAWALTKLWPRPSLGTCALTGWVVGCLAYTFSGPFWLYPDRGTMSLIVPITILGGLGYFANRQRPTAVALGIGAFFLLATPVWTIAHEISSAAFLPGMNAKFVNAEHDAIVAAAKVRASRTDLLLADEPSLLWLAPEYPGVNYCAHFFLTVDYDRKQEEVTKFYEDEAPAQEAFLRAHDVKFLFVATRNNPAKYTGRPGLVPVVANGVGTLFAVDVR